MLFYADRKNFTEYLDLLRPYPPISRETEKHLFEEYAKDKKQETLDKIILHNLRFVVKIALQYKKFNNFNIIDLIQEGNCGLLEAVKRFDHTRGVRFLSYAVYWIRACINNFIMKNWNLVVIGKTQDERRLFQKIIAKESKIIEYKNGEAIVNQEELPEGVTSYKALQVYHRVKNQNTSIEQEQQNNVICFYGGKEEGKYTLIDMLSNFDSVEESVDRSMKLKMINKSLEMLKPREADVIRKRFMQDNPVTLEKIGKKYGISKEMVRLIEKSALKKIKNYLMQ